MDQRIINLFDEYTHKPLKRFAFLKKLVQLTGSTAAAMSALPLLQANYANAETINSQDDRLKTERIKYRVGETEMSAYLVMPKIGGTASVMVIHENRGLNAHIEDVTRRVALAGFIALAPDGLSPLGGTPTDEDQARSMFQQLDYPQTIKNFSGGIDYLKGLSGTNGKVGCLGFCWGGAMANNLAIHAPALNAAVAFYGRQPESSEVGKIKAAVQLHYAEHDERVNAGIENYESALKENNIRYELYRYEGTQHAFHNDTAPTRYNADAAKVAWERTMDFFKRNLT